MSGKSAKHNDDKQCSRSSGHLATGVEHLLFLEDIRVTQSADQCSEREPGVEDKKVCHKTDNQHIDNYDEMSKRKQNYIPECQLKQGGNQNVHVHLLNYLENRRTSEIPGSNNDTLETNQSTRTDIKQGSSQQQRQRKLSRWSIRECTKHSVKFQQQRGGLDGRQWSKQSTEKKHINRKIPRKSDTVKNPVSGIQNNQQNDSRQGSQPTSHNKASPNNFEVKKHQHPGTIVHERTEETKRKSSTKSQNMADKPRKQVSSRLFVDLFLFGIGSRYVRSDSPRILLYSGRVMPVSVTFFILVTPMWLTSAKLRGDNDKNDVYITLAIVGGTLAGVFLLVSIGTMFVIFIIFRRTIYRPISDSKLQKLLTQISRGEKQSQKSCTSPTSPRKSQAEDSCV